MSSGPRASRVHCPGPFDWTDEANWPGAAIIRGHLRGPGMVICMPHAFSAAMATWRCCRKTRSERPKTVASANSCAEKEVTMTGLKTLVAAALISTISTTCALAQAAISEPGAFQAQFPNRDVLNGGALTPAGRMGLELPGGGSMSNNPYAAMGSASPSFRAQRYHSYKTPADTFSANDGRRHSSR